MRFTPRNASRRLVSCVLIGCLGAACSAPGTPARHDVGHTATPVPTSSRATAPTAAPSSKAGPSESLTGESDPYSRDPATLARELDDASTTLRSHQASEADVARAAEFQQLAIRRLVDSSAAFRRQVIGRLDPGTARAARTQISASQALATISDPRYSLPDWHIVSPASPDRLLRFYREAQRRTGVDWTYLAAIELVETRMGRIRGPSSAGALGPMQFTRSTWQTYGNGGDINDDRDSILAAARLLKANGAPADMDAALWHYNPAAGYVRAVEAYAETMRTSESAYFAYWHWQVIYSYPRGTFILPVGYPKKRPVRLPR